MLPRQDPYVENKDDYVELDPQWVANLIDIYNEAMTLIENELASLDARITALGG